MDAATRELHVGDQVPHLIKGANGSEATYPQQLDQYPVRGSGAEVDSGSQRSMVVW